MCGRVFRKRLFSSLILYSLFIAILVFAAQCFPAPEMQITILDQVEVPGEAVVEALFANNCAGTIELTQDLRAVKQFSHHVQVEPFSGVSVSKQAVENEIRSTYKIAKEHGEQVCIVPVQVPAGMFYAYDLEWREVWRQGVFELGDPDDKPEGNYKFMQGVLCTEW